jgi:hypothetical protein
MAESVGIRISVRGISPSASHRVVDPRPPAQVRTRASTNNIRRLEICSACGLLATDDMRTPLVAGEVAISKAQPGDRAAEAVGVRAL